MANVTQDRAKNMIDARKPFTASGLSAIDGAATGMYSTGRMPEHYANLYNATRAQIIYTVMSYATPIGWVLDTGDVVIPDTRYSVTTSRHQGIVRTYL
jgi:hypothetical protein